LLKEPILQAKEMANSPKANEQLRLFQQIFGIEDAVESEVTAMTEQELERKERIQSSQSSTEPKYSF